MALTTATWLANTTGSWTTSGDWSGGVVPGKDSGSTTAALFTGGTAGYTVTLPAGNILNVGTSSSFGATAIALQVNDQFVTLDIGGSITSGAAGKAISELNSGTINIESGGILAIANTYTQTGGMLNVETSGTLTIGKNQGVSGTLSGGTIDVSGGSVTANGNLLQSGGVIDVSSGTVSVASSTLGQTGGSILIGDGTVETANLTQANATLGFNASGGLLQFGIGGSAIDVTMGTLGVTDTVVVISTTNLKELTLHNFFSGDLLEVETTGSLSNGAVVYSGTDAAGTLTVTGTIAGSSVSDVVHITTPGVTIPTSSEFILGTGASFIDITSNVVCFAGGTRILTSNGESSVESLVPGDRVLTLSEGELTERPIRWIGRRRIDIAGHKAPQHVAPVRIRRGAIADNAPHTDLLVSPDHAIFVNGMLICARQLINGATIRQENGWTAIEYFHIELDAHAILFAEGLPAESYLDSGNRGFFVNAAEPLVLHPDLRHTTDHGVRAAASCAPFVFDEASVRPVWQRLADRALALGHRLPMLETTTDPKLRIIAGDRSLRASPVGDGRHVFLLPRGVGEVRVVSSASVPADLRPWLDDRRRLGVNVRRIVLRSAENVQDVPLDHPALSRGWWTAERDGAVMQRWTDGDAVLLLPPSPDPAVLEIHAGTDGMTYPIAADQERRAA